MYLFSLKFGFTMTWEQKGDRRICLASRLNKTVFRSMEMNCNLDIFRALDGYYDTCFHWNIVMAMVRIKRKILET